jgi:hypothetical protein
MPQIASEQHTKAQHLSGLEVLVADLVKRVALLEAARPPPTFLKEEETARYIGVKPATLTMWRHFGKGPTFRKIGRGCFYLIEDVETWLDSQAVVPVPRGTKPRKPVGERRAEI